MTMMMKEMIKRINNVNDLRAEKKRLKLEASVMEYNILDSLHSMGNTVRPVVSIFDGSMRGISFIAKSAILLIPILMGRKKKKSRIASLVGVGTSFAGLLLGEQGHATFKKVGNFVKSLRKKIKKL